MLAEFKYLQQIKKQNETGDITQKKIEKLKTQIPEKLVDFMNATCMYQILYGGRSSAKTRTALNKLLVQAYQRKNQTILCTREFQSSIQTSTYAELKQIILAEELQDIFKIKYDKIECINGTQFIFKGLARDIMQIKSIPNIDICLVEEAETIGKELWDVLDPTLRKEGCQLIVLFNPREKQSATYQRWLIDEINENFIQRIEINYNDNPFNSKLILQKIEQMREHDYARYEHIYLGKVLDMSEDVIFKNKFKILDMDLKYYPETKIHRYQGNAVAMLYGMDFGFSVDPAAMVEVCFLDPDTIYIQNEIYKTGLLPSNSSNKESNYIDNIKTAFGEIALKSLWSADSARPDSIAQLRNDGLRIEGAPKLKNSIESGIEYLLSKKIIVHPRCKNTIFELYNYKYKKDKNSGEITREIIDKHNHAMDALRYCLYRQIAASLRRAYNIPQELLR